jgi:cyanate permease
MLRVLPALLPRIIGHDDLLLAPPSLTARGIWLARLSDRATTLFGAAFATGGVSITSVVVPIMRPAPARLSPIIGAVAMRTSLSHPATALPWQPGFALPS